MTLQLAWDDMSRRVAIVASATAEGYPASNLESGHLDLWWRGVGTGEHFLTRDFGAGNTASLDTVVAANAHRLVQLNWSLALQRTDDGSAWTVVWTKAPVTLGDLAPPDFRHLIVESALDTRRGWRLRLYGSPTAAPELSGGLLMGVRTALPTSPMYGRQLGVERAYRGRDLVASWPIMSRPQARALKAALAAITPDAAEGFVETVSGVGFGGGPQHWVWDPDGRTFSEADPPGPWLLPVTCVSGPAEIVSSSLTPDLDAAPTTVRWRERR